MNPKMKGYYTSSCFMGYVPRFKMYLPFPTEQDYKEFFKEEEIKELKKGKGTS